MQIIDLQVPENYIIHIILLLLHLYSTHIITYDYCQTLTLRKTIHFVLMTNAYLLISILKLRACMSRMSVCGMSLKVNILTIGSD